MKRIFLRQPELGIPSNVLREYKALQLLQDDNIVELLDVFAMVCVIYTVPTLLRIDAPELSVELYAGSSFSYCDGTLLHGLAQCPV